MIAELILQLDLQDVTVVGNDTGGALCQILCANHPELVNRLVLTNCDTFENFPPFPFPAIYALGGHVPGLIAGLDQVLRRAIPAARRPGRSPGDYAAAARRIARGLVCCTARPAHPR